MTFLSPAFLWTLLALLPLGAVYFLKVRPRRKTTTAYFLWEKIFSEKKASSLFNRLRDLLSLLIMALAFGAIAFALARPEFSADERKDLLILIDESASMSADDENGGARLAQAKEAAEEIIIALDGNQRAAVASVSDEISYRSHFTRSPRALIEAIGSISGSDLPLSRKALATLAEDSLMISGNYRTLFLTDGNHEPLTAEVEEKLEILKLGDSIGNAGFVDADLRRLPGGRLGFFFRIASSFEDTVEAEITLRNPDVSEDQIFKLIPVSITPGENEAEIFEMEDAPAGRWTATLELNDAFEKDDTAFLAVPESQPVRIAVGTENRYFFEASILAFQESSGLLALVEESESPDLLVEQFTGSTNSPLSVVFTPTGESPWWTELGGPVEAVAPRVLLPDHPALRHLDLASVAFLGAREITPPDKATILVESETGVPLVYRTAEEGNVAVVVNLDPIQSDFYFSAWFPTLIHGVATYLSGREEELLPVYRPGDRVPIPGFRSGSVSQVSLPNEDEAREWSRETFGPIETLGFYEFENRSGEWPFAASLITSGESLLAGSVEDTLQPISRGNAPAYWLIALAILALTSESILYHRRKLG